MRCDIPFMRVQYVIYALRRWLRLLMLRHAVVIDCIMNLLYVETLNIKFTNKISPII